MNETSFEHPASEPTGEDPRSVGDIVADSAYFAATPPDYARKTCIRQTNFAWELAGLKEELARVTMFLEDDPNNPNLLRERDQLAMSIHEMSPVDDTHVDVDYGD